MIKWRKEGSRYRWYTRRRKRASITLDPRIYRIRFPVFHEISKRRRFVAGSRFLHPCASMFPDPRRISWRVHAASYSSPPREKKWRRYVLDKISLPAPSTSSWLKAGPRSHYVFARFNSPIATPPFKNIPKQYFEYCSYVHGSRINGSLCRYLNPKEKRGTTIERRNFIEMERIFIYHTIAFVSFRPTDRTN